MGSIRGRFRMTTKAELKKIAINLEGVVKYLENVND
jgi:hypothetical protein